MQKLMSYMRSAMEKYEMISEGDCVAVGVSGGKDSLALLYALSRIRKFYPVRFDIKAISLDMCFSGTQSDFSKIAELCKKEDIPYIIKRTEIGRIIFEYRKESNPCSLCARMRRGSLHDAAKEAGCNKIALGHHMDDAAETFMMNLLNNGTIGCFSPVTYLSKKDLYMIRPMIFARESDCARVVRREQLPLVESRCPADKHTEREEIKLLLNSYEKKYGNVREKILGAMQRRNIDGY